MKDLPDTEASDIREQPADTEQAADKQVADKEVADKEVADKEVADIRAAGRPAADKQAAVQGRERDPEQEQVLEQAGAEPPEPAVT